MVGFISGAQHTINRASDGGVAGWPAAVIKNRFVMVEFNRSNRRLAHTHFLQLTGILTCSQFSNQLAGDGSPCGTDTLMNP